VCLSLVLNIRVREAEDVIKCVVEDIVSDVFKFHKREVAKRGQTAVELANI